ncbi:hypothetical protein WT82_29860 [Burkholderia stagnalis]|nr:hypothetical protein WT82_29860 [Burkholderia stagnalis]
MPTGPPSNIGRVACGAGATLSVVSFERGAIVVATVVIAEDSPKPKMMLIRTGRLDMMCEPTPIWRLSSL